MAIPEVPQFCDGSDIFQFPFKNIKDSVLNKISLLNAENARAVVSIKRAKEDIARTISDANDKKGEKSEPPREPDKAKPADSKSAKFAEDIPVNAPTEETLKLLQTAAALTEKYKDFSAFFCEAAAEYSVNTDFSEDAAERNAVYLLKDIASETYGALVLKDSPPDNELNIQRARIIYPDGSFREIKPIVSIDKSGRARFHQLKFPGAKASCVIDTVIKYSARPQTRLPEFDKEFIIQRNIPIASYELKLKLPKNLFFRSKLYNHADIQPIVEENSYSKILTFAFKNIPAFEALPYDPPFNDCAARLHISSMKDWDSFRDWLERIMKDSGAIDPGTASLAQKLTASANNDAEKVRAIYEFLCELRYDTTPIGSRAFRPRLPKEVCEERYGDCKDKANALIAMAGSLGVKGYIALVNRFSSTDCDFPGWQFNHALAFFPKLRGYENGLWCDATDGSTPFASLPPGDIGRTAFIMLDKSFEFGKIIPPDNAENSLSEEIEITILPENRASADLTLKAAGLNDYYLRQELKRASPLQKIQIVQDIVNCSFTGFSVKEVSVSPPEELSGFLVVKAKCFSDDIRLPLSNILPPYDFWRSVSAPSRDRPLQLNDNQPFTVVQRIKINGTFFPQVTYEDKNELCEVSLKSKRGENSSEMETKISVKNTLIKPEDYVKFRGMIVKWYSKFELKED
jgi:transglutaminase-like putative cysteine protease